MRAQKARSLRLSRDNAPRTRPFACRSLGCIALELALGMVWFSNVWLVPYVEFSAYRRKHTLSEPRCIGPQRTAANGSFGGVRGGSDGSSADETALRAFEGAIRANLAAAYNALERPLSGAEGPPAAVNAAQGASQMPSLHAAGGALDVATLLGVIGSPDDVMSARVTQLAADSGVPMGWGEKQIAAAAAASAASQRRSAAFARFTCAALVFDFRARESVTDLTAHEWLSEPPAAATAAAVAAEAVGPRQSEPVEVAAARHGREIPTAIHE